MLRRIAPVMVAAVVLATTALAQPRSPGGEVPVPALSLPQIAERIAGRYRGRLIAIRLDRPRPPERRFDTRVVYEAEYLTPAGNRLTIRLDGDTGMFLRVDGVGQAAARILP